MVAHKNLSIKYLYWSKV